MLRSFEERERAEELLFVIGEKQRFLSRRASAQALAYFAVRKLGCDDQTSRAYAEVLIDAMVHGASDESLLERVQADLSANLADFSLEELRVAMLGGSDLARRSAPVGPSHSPVHSSSRL
ncbi:ATPase inhibitor subunit zeta [Methylorubrum extorquens]